MSSKKFYEQSLVLPIFLWIVFFLISLISSSYLGDKSMLWEAIEVIWIVIMVSSTAAAIPYLVTAVPLAFWMKVRSRTNQELRRALLVSPLLFAFWVTLFLLLLGNFNNTWSIDELILLVSVFLFAAACAFLWIGPVLWYGRRLEVREADSAN